MAITEVQNRSSAMLGAQIKEGAGQGPDASHAVQTDENASKSLPQDKVQFTKAAEMSILTGPTPGHNIVQIKTHDGKVIEIPPNSKSALYAYIQTMLKRGI